MLQRCENPDHPAWKNYGGRGITVCPKWRAFRNFLRDMGDRPDGWTLERIDNNLGYNQVNCRWATWPEQAQNRRKRPVKKVYVKRPKLGVKFLGNRD